MLATGLSVPTQSGIGIAAATVSPMISYEIGQQFKKHNAEGTPAHILAHAILGAAVAAAGDNNALAGALSAGGSEVAAPYISKWLYGKDKGSDLTARERDCNSDYKLVGYGYRSSYWRHNSQCGARQPECAECSEK